MRWIYLGALLLICSVFGPTADSIRTRCREGDDDWYYFNGNCYIWSKRTEGWFGAEKQCQKLGGRLVSIGSRAENSFLHAMTLCDSTFWIGMVKTETRTHGFAWWDDSHNNYTEVFSKNTNAYHDCVYFNVDGRWHNYYCQNQFASVCMAAAPAATPEVEQQPNQQSINEESNVDSKQNGKCPDSWLELENNCYFVSSEKTNYFNAQMSCQSKGATVATILSAREQQLINIALGCGTEAWIGLEKVRPCIANPGTQFCWLWMDQTPLNFTDWYSGHPSINKDIECATTIGHWQSRSCYSEYRYICRKK